MPCDTRLKRGQTITQRKAEILDVIERLKKGLLNGSVKPVVGPQGAIAFQGLSDGAREGVTDACAYRRLMATGSPLALQAIQRAEMLAGRKIDQKQVAVGAHSHDGGATWHSHKG